MIPADCTRDDCLLGRRRIRYERLCREYRCDACGGRPTTRRDADGRWYPVCARCDGRDFVHEAELKRQRQKVREMFANLPAEIVAAYHRQKGEKRDVHQRIDR